MKQQLPKKVNVCGLDYVVSSVTPQTKDAASSMLLGHQMGNLGSTISSDCHISINALQSREQARDTLLHELIHAVDYQLSIGLEERQVQCLASGVLQVLRSNPKVVSYLLGE